MNKKEAIEIIKKNWPDSRYTMLREALQTLIPELKESDDDRIRKEIIQYLKDYPNLPNGNYCRDDFFAWLEKQGEKTEPIDGFNTEFERQISHLIASTINKEYDYTKDFVKWTSDALLNYAKHELEKQGRQKSQCKSAFELWKDMRFEVYMQASGNRHEPNYSDDSTKMFSINDIDEIFEKVAEKQGEQKPNDKVEPKFKVGDWIVYSRNDSSMEILYVYDIRDGRYYFNDNVHFSWSVKECDEKCHLWTIQDAKDGDVLADCFGNICIYQKPSTNTYYHTHCYGNHKYFIDGGGSHEVAGTYPATKEQRDLLFQKMKEYGYEWDTEKKELKKIEQKISWNEEDEKLYNSALWHIKNSCGNGGKDSGEFEVYNWLKSLKDRVQSQPKQLWSEEDKSMYIRTLGILGKCYMGELPTKVEEELRWFKSITDKAQPQTNQYDKGYEDGYSAAKYNQWKPKKEELEALRKRTYFCEGIDANLDSLYTNLLKL